MRYQSLALILNSGFGNRIAMNTIANRRTQASLIAATRSDYASHPENGGGWEQVTSKQRRAGGRRKPRKPPSNGVQTNMKSPPNLKGGPNVKLSSSDLPVQSTEDSSKPFMIVLVGVPGSGKSTFAEMLVNGNPSKYVRICQDKLKTRKKCEKLCKRSLEKGQIPIIDRCNFDPSQRLHFLSIAKEFGVPVDCIEFSYSMQVCLTRCRERVGHETITKANAPMVLRRIFKDFVPPQANSLEELFRSHRTVTAFEESNDIVSEYLNTPEPELGIVSR